jgi:hypothetical protein
MCARVAAGAAGEKAVHLRVPVRIDASEEGLRVTDGRVNRHRPSPRMRAREASVKPILTPKLNTTPHAETGILQR